MKANPTNGGISSVPWRACVWAGLLLVPQGTVYATDASAHAFAAREGRVTISVHRSHEPKRVVYEYDNDSKDIATLRRQFVQVAYRPVEQIEIQGRFGRMNWDPHAWLAGIYDYGPAWGIGLRTRVWSWPEYRISVGTSLQYNRARPDDLPRYYRPRPLHSFSGFIEEWQVSADVHHETGPVSVFGGVRYAQVDLAYTHGSDFRKDRKGGFEAHHPFGVYGGAELALGSSLLLGAEVRWHTTWATTFGLGYRF